MAAGCARPRRLASSIRRHLPQLGTRILRVLGGHTADGSAEPDAAVGLQAEERAVPGGAQSGLEDLQRIALPPDRQSQLPRPEVEHLGRPSRRRRRWQSAAGWVTDSASAPAASVHRCRRRFWAWALVRVTARAWVQASVAGVAASGRRGLRRRRATRSCRGLRARSRRRARSGLGRGRIVESLDGCRRNARQTRLWPTRCTRRHRRAPGGYPGDLHHADPEKGDHQAHDDRRPPRAHESHAPMVGGRQWSAAGLSSVLWTAGGRPHACRAEVSGDRAPQRPSPAPAAPARSCSGR